jgi:hypothetical protein
MENDPPQTDHSSNVEFCTPQRQKLWIMREISRVKQAQESKKKNHTPVLKFRFAPKLESPWNSVLPSPTAEAKGNSRKQNNMGPEEEWKRARNFQYLGRGKSNTKQVHSSICNNSDVELPSSVSLMQVVVDKTRWENASSTEREMIGKEKWSPGMASVCKMHQVFRSQQFESSERDNH